MPDVSKLNLDGTTYKIKDDDARKYLVVVNNTSQDATKVNITTSDNVVELALQSDVDRIENTIKNSLQINRVVWIGDSWSYNSSYNFPNTACSYLGVPAVHRHIYAEGSTGFVHQNASSHSFATLLSSAISAMSTSEKAEVTHVIVAGGGNDVSENFASVDTAMSTFVTNARAAFPNAKIFFGFCSATTNVAQLHLLGNLCCVWKNCNSYGGCYYLSGVEYIAHNWTYLDGTAHPNTTGYARLARGFAQAILRGSTYVAYPHTAIYTAPAGFGTAARDVIWSSLDNGLVTIFSNHWIRQTGKSYSVSPNGETSFELLTVTKLYALGNAYEQISCNCSIYAKIGGAWTLLPGLLTYYNGTIRFAPIQITSDSAPASITITDVWIPRFTMVGEAIFN